MKYVKTFRISIICSYSWYRSAFPFYPLSLCTSLWGWDKTGRKIHNARKQWVPFIILLILWLIFSLMAMEIHHCFPGKILANAIYYNYSLVISNGRHCEIVILRRNSDRLTAFGERWITYCQIIIKTDWVRGGYVCQKL